MNRWVVILAGGVGSRFWPLSTPDRPKQLLPLVGEEPMLAATARRTGAVAAADRTLVLTSASLRHAAARVVPRIPAANVVAEPSPAGTAAALTWAAREIEGRPGGGRDAVMISVHADWSVADEPAFQQALIAAAETAARHHALVTVGIPPRRPDPGFGYIVPAAGDAAGARRVEQFVEKPDRARAEQLIARGALWNSGIFAWTVGDFLDEIRARTPEVADALKQAPDDAARFFATVRPIAVDHGVLERSDRVMVLRGDFGWDDVGTWSSLARLRPADKDGNAIQGHVVARDARDNVAHAEGGAIVLYGVNDLVVVSRPGVTLVTTKDRAADLKSLVESLPPDLRG